MKSKLKRAKKESPMKRIYYVPKKAKRRILSQAQINQMQELWMVENKSVNQLACKFSIPEKMIKLILKVE